MKCDIATHIAAVAIYVLPDIRASLTTVVKNRFHLLAGH